jgi:GTP-binding protein
VLGTVNTNGSSLLFEDVPGLIEGASEGKGLGHEFLKHIERCYILVHMISLSASDNSDIVDAYETIENELKHYGKGVENKPIFLVGNKIDTDDYADNLKKLEKKLKIKIFTISAKDKINTDALVQKIFNEYSIILKELKAKLEEAIEEKPVDNSNIARRKENDKLIGDVNVIKVDEHNYKVESDYLKY